jgi:hypothetical protein
MRINWRNIGILIFVLVILILLLRHGHAVSDAVANIDRIGPGHGVDEQTAGLLALGFIGVSLVAIVRLLTQSRPPDRGERRHGRPDDRED